MVASINGQDFLDSVQLSQLDALFWALCINLPQSWQILRQGATETVLSQEGHGRARRMASTDNLSRDNFVGWSSPLRAIQRCQIHESAVCYQKS